MQFPLLESSLPPYSFGLMDSIMHTCAHLLERFTMITSEELIKIEYVINKTTCLSDPFPSKLVMSHYRLLKIPLCILYRARNNRVRIAICESK